MFRKGREKREWSAFFVCLSILPFVATPRTSAHAAHTMASTTTSSSPDPLALHPDGSAVSPAGFRAHLLGDPSAVADLAAADPAALAVLRSGADGPLQELLKAVYAVSEEARRGEEEGRGGRGASDTREQLLERARARARAPSTAPPHSHLNRRKSAGPSTRPAPCPSAPSTPSARPRPCPGKNGGERTEMASRERERRGDNKT